RQPGSGRRPRCSPGLRRRRSSLSGSWGAPATRPGGRRGRRPVRRAGRGGGGPPPVAPGGAVQSIETELRQAESHYENAIKGLEAIANTEQSELDPRTPAPLQKNP